MRRTAFVTEVEEWLREEGRWCTGRFVSSVQDGSREQEFIEDLSLDEALEWARARAERVLIRYGEEPGEHYSAGVEHPRGLPRWPPPDLPPVLLRRRHPEERWRDRTDADPPIEWRVDADLLPMGREFPPHDELRRRRREWRAAAADIAARAGADAWDSKPLDLFIADMTEAERHAGGEGFGWISYGAVAMHVVLTVTASTATGARAEGAGRLELPPGWQADLAVRPL